jgi:xeroderma pigmentosum group C-complementing protein
MWRRSHHISRISPAHQARLISLTPLALQNAFSLIHKSRVPDQNQRGRLFEAAVNNLTEWWSQTFFQVEPTGHIRNRLFDEVQASISGLSLDDLLDALESEEGEVIRTPKSLMKHALMQSGSRDVSAQLFTALCRALGIPARLVVSLQSVPWQASIGKPKPTVNRKQNNNGKGKEKEVVEDDDLSSEDVPTDVKWKGKAKEGSFPGVGIRLDGKNISSTKGKEKAPPVITLRKSRSKGRRLGSSSSSPAPRPNRPADPTTTPPVFWTEVFSRADVRWLPVDPIRGIVNKRKVFDPSPSSSSGPSFATTRQENRMVYVVGFEEDGYARDVTPRYARDYSAKVAKAQEVGGRTGGKGRKVWWERLIGIVRRPYRLVSGFRLIASPLTAIVDER